MSRIPRASIVSYLWRINWLQAASTVGAVAPILTDPSETTPKGLHAEHWLVLLETLHFNMINGIIVFFSMYFVVSIWLKLSPRKIHFDFYRRWLSVFLCCCPNMKTWVYIPRTNAKYELLWHTHAYSRRQILKAHWSVSLANHWTPDSVRDADLHRHVHRYTHEHLQTHLTQHACAYAHACTCACT